MQVVYNNVCEGQLLLFSALLEASLHDTAAVLVRADLDAMVHACIENKLGKPFILFTTFTIRLLRIL